MYYVKYKNITCYTGQCSTTLDHYASIMREYFTSDIGGWKRPAGPAAGGATGAGR